MYFFPKYPDIPESSRVCPRTLILSVQKNKDPTECFKSLKFLQSLKSYKLLWEVWQEYYT